MRVHPKKLASLAFALIAALQFATNLGGDTPGAKAPAASSDSHAPVASNFLRQLPLAFEPNHGQAAPDVRFLARTGRGTLAAHPHRSAGKIPRRA